MVVPRPGSLLTSNSSMKFSMMVKPMPERSSSGFDVYSGCCASSRSSIPLPLSSMIRLTVSPSIAAEI
ncbi:hypothetical protein D3C73_1424320 [compost metagenome]